MMLSLFLLLSQGQVQNLYNEGTLLGPIVKIDCVGPNIVCDIPSTYRGRITISGPSGTGSADGTNTGDVTIGTANGLSLAGQAISLATAVAGGSNGALLGTDKTKLDALSGTNTGDQTKTCGAGDFIQQIAAGTGSVCGTPSSGAPTSAQYWVGAADGTLSAEKDLSALATGLVINTAGVPSAFAGTSCTNQFPRSLSASGAATCAGVAIADHTATGTPSATTFYRGDNTWATPASGSGNAVEVTVTMPSDMSGWAQTVVTGQTWVAGTSKIVCQPFNDGGDSNNTDEVYSLAEFATTVSTRSAGVGFTLTARSSNGPTGTFKFHCLGV